jgi:hypothetical protein
LHSGYWPFFLDFDIMSLLKPHPVQLSVRVMMALAGHRNMATTQRYIDLRPGVLRNAVELV